MDQFPVMEHFYTIQGEGFHTGRAAYFIRLAGCDVGCVWCDVKESWNPEGHPMLSIDDLLIHLETAMSKLVVVTGGEPFMHDLTQLCSRLKEKGFELNIETSGAYPVSGQWDWICLSPKKFKAPLPDVLKECNELKVVVYNESDFDWADKYAAQVKSGCRLYLQPEWSKSSSMTPLIIEFVKTNPQWQICIQTHKYIDVP